MRQARALAVLLIDDAGVDVRRAAASTLGGLGDPRIAELLVPGVENPDARPKTRIPQPALVAAARRRSAARRSGSRLAP